MLLLLICIILCVSWYLYMIGNHREWLTAQQMQSYVKQKDQNKKHVVRSQDLKDYSKKQISKNNVVYTLSNQKQVSVVYGADNQSLDLKPQMLKKLTHSQRSELLRGFVSVPGYAINEPVYEGVSQHVLAIGSGLNQPNVRFDRGRITIFAHNMGDYNAIYPFKPTKFSAMQTMTNDVIGHSIIIKDQTFIYRYKITGLDKNKSVSILNKELSKPIQNKTAMIQLICCLEDDAFWRELKANHYQMIHAPKRIVLTGQLESIRKR